MNARIASLVNVAFSGQHNALIQFLALSTLIAGGALAVILSILAIPALLCLGLLIITGIVIALPVVVAYMLWTDTRRTTARLQREAATRLQERMERTIRVEVARLEQANNASRIADVFSARTVDAGEPTLAVAACSPVEVVEAEPAALIETTRKVKARKPSKSKGKTLAKELSTELLDTWSNERLAAWLRNNGHKSARKNWSREKLLTLAQSVGK